MNRRSFLLAMACLSGFFAMVSCTVTMEVDKPEEALKSVSFEKVRMEDEFWLPRLEIQKKTLVPFSLEKNSFSDSI